MATPRALPDGCLGHWNYCTLRNKRHLTVSAPALMANPPPITWLTLVVTLWWWPYTLSSFMRLLHTASYANLAQPSIVGVCRMLFGLVCTNVTPKCARQECSAGRHSSAWIMIGCGLVSLGRIISCTCETPRHTFAHTPELCLGSERRERLVKEM